jgi:hypothetical protein
MRCASGLSLERLSSAVKPPLDQQSHHLKWLAGGTDIFRESRDRRYKVNLDIKIAFFDRIFFKCASCR